jgi:hypothetical protein
MNERVDSELFSSAHSVVEEMRSGQMPDIETIYGRSAGTNDALIEKLRLRLPGFTRDEYENAIVYWLSREPTSPPGRNYKRAFYRLTEFTFIWAFLVAPLGLRNLLGWSGWLATYGYSFFCATAALLIVRSKQNTGVPFAITNAICAIAWIIFLAWIAHAFGRSFLR